MRRKLKIFVVCQSSRILATIIAVEILIALRTRVSPFIPCNKRIEKRCNHLSSFTSIDCNELTPKLQRENIYVQLNVSYVNLTKLTIVFLRTKLSSLCWLSHARKPLGFIHTKPLGRSQRQFLPKAVSSSRFSKSGSTV